MKNIDTPEKLREIINSFRVSRIILTAYELDVFSNIASGGSESAIVAQRIKSNVRATDRLMNALCAIGLLEKRNSKFFNTDFSSKYLSKSSKEYLLGLMHAVSTWDTWSTMTQVVKTGRSQRDEIQSRNTSKWPEAFIGAMHERASIQAQDVLDKLDLDGVRHLLDIGGGSGVYSMNFVSRDKRNKATIFDLSGIIPITKKYVKAEGLTKQINFICGDYNKNALGEAYDMAFLSAIVHINSPEQNLMLIKKCYNALNNGGMVVIQDHVMDDDRTSPYGGALFALNMLVATECGDTYTEKEIHGWLKEAGFKGIKRIETFNNAMLVGRKTML